jgi:hypothetical protein
VETVGIVIGDTRSSPSRWRGPRSALQGTAVYPALAYLGKIVALGPKTSPVFASDGLAGSGGVKTRQGALAGLAWPLSPTLAFGRENPVQFIWGDYHGRKGAEPIDRRDRLGTRRPSPPQILPDCICPLLAKRFLRGGDP